MSSYTRGGEIIYKHEKEAENGNTIAYDWFNEYPFEVPEIKLKGMFEEYYPQTSFSWDENELILSYKNHMIKIIESSYLELLAEDENGNIVWMDGRNAPYSGCWGGKYLNHVREAREYKIINYNIKRLEKKIYNIVFESSSPINENDMRVLERDGYFTESKTSKEDDTFETQNCSNKDNVV